MLIPSIDIQNGNAVQLIGGKEKAIDAGNPKRIMDSFRLAGEVAVIDLDAAMGKGSNRKAIEPLLQQARCRVGGGIRDVETAISWLDAGAQQVILGTQAKPEILKQLPRERVIAALDAVQGEVVIDGWQTKTGVSIEQRIDELLPYVGGFLITFVELEGRLGGTNLGFAEKLIRQAAGAAVTIAGGITTPNDIAILDRLGADAQVGMALYSGTMHLADAIAAPLVQKEPNQLYPTVVCNEHGTALGLAWSSAESLRHAVDQRSGVYFSRSRNSLWIKGQSSGATQQLLRIDLDCDRDTLRFIVRQHGAGFCHKNTTSCWGSSNGLELLEETIQRRLVTAPEGSYTKRLLDDGDLLTAKIVEEASEFCEASAKEEIAAEAADLLYFTLVKLGKAGVTLADIFQVLDARQRTVSRRPGDRKVNS